MVGLILMAFSLTPSLIPRSWAQQAVISALSFVSGYGIGVGLNALWRYLELPVLPQRYQKRTTQILLAVSIATLLFYLYRSLAWQNALRQIVELEPVGTTHPLGVALLATALALLLLLIFRLLWWLAQATVALISKFIPRRIGRVLGIVVAIGLITLLVNGVLLRVVSDALNSTYALRDSSTYANVVQPTSSLRAGSPESLAGWETLGREGRRFVGTGPTVEDLAEFWGDDQVKEPVRIYVGSKSADSLQARAELILDELIRTGAFEREVLVVVTSTGNGWVDANSVDALEYMYRGDTAIAAFQYSYLPSVYSLLADKDTSTQATMAMFNEIHQYWAALDEETRPALYLYGLSLGAYGSQAAVSHVSQFNDPIDGALWAGPPFVSEFWQQITRDRDSGTPIWHPVYQGGATIRFTNTGEELQDEKEEWQENRFLYLQQAGDPIVFFTVNSLYRQPEWLDQESRSPKAPPDMRWYPVVTFWQTIFDMVLATSDTLPDGNGHRYSSDAYIDSWVALTVPDNWDSQRTVALKERFDRMGNPNKP